MKSVICQLAWKLGTTMCFCHSILIFKIIPIFKIMIVIRFQIWFLIKFKLQKKEWIWLKLCFSHAKGLWHYKYRSQYMQKKEEDDIEKKNKGENPKKKKTKNRGRRDWKEEEKESILQPVPALLPSPSRSASPGKVFFFSLFLCNCCKKTMRR